MVTVTYMLEGQFNHEDFAGHVGRLGPGDLQWMSAARGIMHAEMPIHRDEAGRKLCDAQGLQLWIDLPAVNKKDEPTYQEFPKAQVPTALPRSNEPEETEGKDWHVKVIAGRSHGVESPVRTPDQGACWYLDVTLSKPGARIFQEIPTGFNAFIYSMGPAPIRVGSSDAPAEQLATSSSPSSLSIHEAYHTLVLSNLASISDPRIEPASVPQENGVWIEHAGTDTNETARLVVIAGQPLDQQVVQHGPFVLTTTEEVYQTILDFQGAKNGFERAAGWKSKIGGRR